MTESVIQAARKHWALGDVRVSLVAARENRVFRVEAARDKSQQAAVALRLHRPGYRSQAEINSELLWMNMLAENGIAVPRPIQASNGSYMESFDGVVVDVLSWVDGTPLSRIDSKTEAAIEIYRKLGCILATMHRLVDAWQPPPHFDRPTWDLIGDQPSWGRFWENPGLSRSQRSRFIAFRDEARKALQAQDLLDIGLIHADLVPDNVLYNGTQLQLIDFDDGGFGYRLFDLATVTHRSRRSCKSGEIAAAVIDGYGTERPLDQSTLSLFEAMRACSYLGWNISRMGETNAIERNPLFIAEAEAAITAFYS